MFFKNKKKEKEQINDIVAVMKDEKLDIAVLEHKEIITTENNENEDNNNFRIYNLLDQIIGEFILKKPRFINEVERGLTSREELKKEVFKFLDIKSTNVSLKDKEDLLSNFETYIWGYGQLQELIDDETITDIRTIDYNNIRVKRFGKREKSHIQFHSLESMKQYINYIAIKNKATLSEISAIQKLTDKDTSDKFILRINITSEFINSVNHQYLVIRKIPKYKYNLKQLREKNMLDENIENYLMEAIQYGLSIFVIGKGASGKTTLINALLDEMPFNKSGLVIQEAEELFSNVHPDLMFQKVKYAKGESKIQYTLKELSINGLLTDLDYFIIGEIKGDEAIDMVNAIYTGHVGISSVHGSSAMEGIDKLIHYMKYASDMKESVMLHMLSHIDVLIFMKDFKCLEMVEVAGFDYKEERLIFNPVFEYQIKNDNGNLVGEFVKQNDSCKKVKDKILYEQFKNQ